MKCDINLYAEKRNFTQKLEKREWSEFSKREYPENFGSRFDNLKKNLTLGLELSMPCHAIRHDDLQEIFAQPQIRA